MKINLFVKAVSVSVLAFILAAVCYHYSGDVFKMPSSQFWEVVAVKTNYKTFEEKVSLSSADTLVIQAVNANVSLEHSSSKDGRVSLTTGTERGSAFQSEEINHKLLIKVADLDPYANSTLTVRIPNNVKHIEIKDMKGDVSINNLKLDNLSVSNTHGDIKLESGEVQQAQLQSVNGDVICHAMVDKLEIKTVFGDIKVETSQDKPRFRFETVSGDIKIQAPQTLHAVTDLQSVNGSVTPVNAENKDKDVENKGYINAKSVNGDVSLNN